MKAIYCQKRQKYFSTIAVQKMTFYLKYNLNYKSTHFNIQPQGTVGEKRIEQNAILEVKLP